MAFVRLFWLYPIAALPSGIFSFRDWVQLYRRFIAVWTLKLYSSRKLPPAFPWPASLLFSFRHPIVHPCMRSRLIHAACVLNDACLLLCSVAFCSLYCQLASYIRPNLRHDEGTERLAWRTLSVFVTDDYASKWCRKYYGIDTTVWRYDA